MYTPPLTPQPSPEMVTVSEAADRFMEVLQQKVRQFAPSPPQKTMLRGTLLEWINQLPLPQLRDYIMADFDNHLTTLYNFMIEEFNNLAENSQTMNKTAQNRQKSTQNTTNYDYFSNQNNISPYQNGLYVQPTPETAPYMSFDPQPSTYMHFLTQLMTYLTPNEPNGDVFWTVLDTILASPPLNFSTQDSLIMYEMKFHALFEIIIRYVPTLSLGNNKIITKLHSYSTTILNHILDYFSQLPRHPNHTHTSTLSKAISTLCIIIRSNINGQSGQNGQNGQGQQNDNQNFHNFDWLELLFKSFHQSSPHFDLSYLLVDMMILWSHFILVPSLFSQSSNWSPTNVYQSQLQDLKFTLLSDTDYNLIQDVVLFSPLILIKLVPYMTHITTMLSPQTSSYQTIFTVPRLVGGLLFIFSNFSHIGTILRFYNTIEFSQLADLIQLKTYLIHFAKTLQQTTMYSEGIMLPLDLQNASVRIVQLVHKAEQKKQGNYIKSQRKKALKARKIKKEQKLAKIGLVGDNDSDDNDEKEEEEEGEDDNNGIPLLSMHINPIIVTLKDFFNNQTMKQFLYPTSNIPFSRGQELIIVFIQKIGGGVSSSEDYEQLTNIVNGTAASLKNIKKRADLAKNRSKLAMQKKQKWLRAQAGKLRKDIDKTKKMSKEEKEKIHDDIFEDESLTDEQRLVMLAKRMEEQEQLQQAQRKRERARLRIEQERKELNEQIQAAKSNPLSDLLNQLVQEANSDSDDDDDDDDDNDNEGGSSGKKKGTNSINQDGNDGNDVSFEDENFGGLADTLLTALKTRARQDDMDSGEKQTKNDSDDDDSDSDDEFAVDRIGGLIQDELFTFQSNQNDFDDFGQIDIE